MLGNYIKAVEKLEDENFEQLLTKMATNIDKELSEQLTDQIKFRLMEEYEMDYNELQLINDITKYLFNNAASAKKFDKIAEILTTNLMSPSKIQIFSKVFQDNAELIFQNLQDNGVVNQNQLHNLTTEVLIPLSSSNLPIQQSQMLNDKLSFYYSEDVQNPKTMMKFQTKGNNDSMENLQEFSFQLEKAELQSLFEETEIIKKKL